MAIVDERYNLFLQLAMGLLGGILLVLSLLLPIPGRTEGTYRETYSAMPVFYLSTASEAELEACAARKIGKTVNKRTTFPGIPIYKVRILSHRKNIVEGIVGKDKDAYNVSGSSRTDSESAVFIIPENRLPKALVPFVRRYDLSGSKLFWAIYFSLLVLLASLVPSYAWLRRKSCRTPQPTESEDGDADAGAGLQLRKTAAMARKGLLPPGDTELREDENRYLRRGSVIPLAVAGLTLVLIVFAMAWYRYLYPPCNPEQLAYILEHAV